MKRVNKSSKDDKEVSNVHGVNMKSIMIGGTTVGPVGHISPIECLKELKKKKLKKIGDHIPLKIVDLIGKASKTTMKASKITQELNNP